MIVLCFRSLSFRWQIGTDRGLAVVWLPKFSAMRKDNYFPTPPRQGFPHEERHVLIFETKGLGAKHRAGDLCDNILTVEVPSVLTV